jgi:hypothetical protein
VFFETINSVVASGSIEVITELNLEILVTIKIALGLLISKSIIKTREFVTVRLEFLEETFSLVMFLCSSDIGRSVSLCNCVVSVKIALGLLGGELLKTFTGVASVFVFTKSNPMASGGSIVF